MPKIAVETLKFILQRNIEDIRKIAGVMQEIELELKAEQEEKDLKPKVAKKQNVIMVSDPDGKLQDVDLVGWIAQIPEDDDISTTPDRIIQAAHAFNCTPKGIRMPVETIGEACEVCSPYLFKEQDVWVKTKTPLLLVSVNNKIPS